MFVDLDRVPSAEGDLRAACALEMRETVVGADLAVGPRGAGADLGVVAGPEIQRKERAPQGRGVSGEELEGFGDGERGGEVDGGVENAGGVAGFHDARRRCREDAGQAGGPFGLSEVRGQDVHCGGVGADGSGIDPRLLLLDGVVVEKITGFEVVCGIEEDVRVAEQGVDIGGGKVSDMRVDGDLGVEVGDTDGGRLRPWEETPGRRLR